MTYYAEVILPLALGSLYTYSVPEEFVGRIGIGHRVLVQFGARKYYTAIVAGLANRPPSDGFQLKPVIALLDEAPILRQPQLKLWNWIADYYLCSIGDVMRAALPAALKVESATYLEPNADFDPLSEKLSDREAIVLQQLEHTGKRMSVAEIEKVTGLTGLSSLATRMLDKGALIISERLRERYTTRKATLVRPLVNGAQERRSAFESVRNARQQERALLALLTMSDASVKAGNDSGVTREALLERAGVSWPIVQALAKRGLAEIVTQYINRFASETPPSGVLPTLSQAQSAALECLHRHWLTHETVLLHGVTSSGKTELYIHLIDHVLHQGHQVLYMVPEIALTTQLTHRLQDVFGSRVVVYHSKFSDSERVDLYRKILSSNEPLVVVGPRSAMFLPFAHLGLVIVDEEHEQSYKQQDPAPRYNGRDAALVLARMHGAKALLGSATPSVETYYKAQTGRYALVTLHERYGGVKLPDINVIDIESARKRGQLKGNMAKQTADLLKDAVADGQGQAIVFLNRRGYAPVAQCKMCAWTPKCEHCDVSLTYHKGVDKLQCHYCGTYYPLPVICPQCKEPAIEIYGYGTERMEDELGDALDGKSVIRMDLDTTRIKDGYEKLIADFSEHKADILVGTQMVTKGLDFARVRAVAIMNADGMLNQPDFRAAERAYNMMSQVAGRAGRRDTQGTVAIQTRTPQHPLLSYVQTHDYEGYYNHELEQRRRYFYPPFTRIIDVYVKHRDMRTVDSLSRLYAQHLSLMFGNRVFGPEVPTVSRIQTYHIRKIMLKVETNASMARVKELLRESYNELHARRVDGIKSAVVYYDVDPY